MERQIYSIRIMSKIATITIRQIIRYKAKLIIRLYMTAIASIFYIL